MVDHSLPLYQNAPDTWDEITCRKLASRLVRDSYGTKYPFKGYLGNNYGDIRYNGGCSRDGKWYQGETRPLPIIPKGFNIFYVPTWGYRIVKTS